MTLADRKMFSFSMSDLFVILIVCSLGHSDVLESELQVKNALLSGIVLEHIFM